MNADRYQRAKELFLAACELTPDDRARFLDEECGDDKELRAEVESLIMHHEAPHTATVGTSTYTETVGRDAPAPERVGAYRIVRELGRGGMGIVYLGIQEIEKIKRHVAIKMLKRGMDTEEILQRFELERQVLGALNHSGIARLYDAGETEEGTPYFVMEYVEGTDIVDYCDVHRLHIDERLDLFCKVCEAVQHAHQNLVVHRDLKPSNIIVEESGQPKLLDFGIAKLLNPDFSFFGNDPTAPEMRIMTPEYASPEQVRGHPITTASDIYSLGVLLYQLLSGHRPYRLQSRVRAELERIICEEDPERPSTAISRVEVADPTTRYRGDITPESVSNAREVRPDRLRKSLAGDIDNIVLMAMRKEPQRRYRSAEQLAEDIRRHLGGHPVIARPDTVGYRVSKFVTRNKSGVAAAVAMVLLLVAGIAGTSWGWSQASVARDAEAEQRALAEEETARVLALQGQLQSLLTANFDTVNTFLTTFEETFAQMSGSTAARQVLHTSALENLTKLRDDVGNDPALLRELALAYERVGDVEGGVRNPSRGDASAALEHYQEALALRRAIAIDAPEDAELAWQIATNHVKIADMQRLRGDVADAVASAREAVNMTEQLLQEAPDDLDRQRHLALTLVSLGSGLVSAGEADEAEAVYERSHRIREKILAKQPDDVKSARAVSVTHLRLGGRQAAKGDLDGALEHYRAATEIRLALLEAEPENSRYQRDVETAESFYYDVLTQLGRQEEAQPRLERALAIAESRMELNPDSARARRDLALALDRLSRARAAAGRFDSALDAADGFHEHMAALTAVDPTNMQYKMLLAASHDRRAAALSGLGRHDEAIEASATGVEHFEQLVERDEDVRRQRDHAAMLEAHGRRLQAAGRGGEAFRTLESARSTLVTLRKTHPDDQRVAAEYASVLEAMSSVMSNLDDTRAALTFAEEALAAAPRVTTDILRRLADAHYDLGHVEQAREALERALDELDPRSDAVADRIREEIRATLADYDAS